jgi:hypothetical protein
MNLLPGEEHKGASLVGGLDLTKSQISTRRTCMARLVVQEEEQQEEGQGESR